MHRLVLAASVLAGLAACASTHPARPPAAISHIVLIELADPRLAGELIEDSHASLATIPSVTSFAAGRHIDTGRDTVLADYDVGLYVGFDSEADYAAYVEHPKHVRLVERWKPRIDAMRVYDVLDETP